MRCGCQFSRIWLVVIVALATAAGLTGASPRPAIAAVATAAGRPGLAPVEAAAACRGWKVVRIPRVGRHAGLHAVAVVPGTTRAWAAGQYSFGQSSYATLLLHWNGTSWQRVPSPHPSRNSDLGGVTALSHTDAWAVGHYHAGNLILRWNGTKWMQWPSPSPGGPHAANFLSAVSATSSRNAWAVGSTGVYSGEYSQILHWNGTRWRQVRSPNPDDGNLLNAVAAVSATDAWAVGDGGNGNEDSRTIIEHWNGTTWTVVPSPNPETGLFWEDDLNGVAATSASSAWAVGFADYEPSGGDVVAGRAPTVVPIIEHWNGTRWKLVHSPNLAGATILQGVTAASAHNAWAVGSFGSDLSRTLLVEHWNGKSWKRATSRRAPKGALEGVAASSSKRFVLAVGTRTLYHC